MITNLTLAAILAFTRFGGLMGQGDLVYSDARISAVGGVFSQNPAFVPQNGIYAVLHLSAGAVSEQWMRPAYDRFGSTVGQLTEYSYQHSFVASPDFTIGYADKNKFASISKRKIYDLSYKYDRVFRSDYYTVNGFHTIEQSGDVSRLGIDFGYRFRRGHFGVDLGASVSQYTIRKDYFEALGNADGDVDTTERSLKLSQMVPSAGMTVRLGYRAAFGIAYRLPITFLGDSDSVSYPMMFEAGVKLTPPSKIVTNVFFGYRYDGDIHYSVGFEHEIIEGEWIRFSGSISENLKSLRWTPSFGFGFGHRSSHLGVDIGMRFHPCNYGYWAYGKFYSVREWVLTSTASISLNF